MGTSLDGLNSRMTGLNGDLSTLQLKPEDVQPYLNAIDSAKSDMQTQLADARGLRTWLEGRSVGEFDSAKATKKHLQDDVQEFINAILAYTTYLDNYKAAVEAARKSIQEHG